MGSSTGRRAPLHLKQIQVVSTIYFDLSVDTDEILDNVSYSEEEYFLLDILERFNPKNINAALREYFEDKNERVTEILGCVNYFEEKRALLEILERFDVLNVNDALREYFGLQTRNKLPDFVDAEKL
nr:MAG TPA: hypothetical protein [Caudoviricetes sp.]